MTADLDPTATTDIDFGDGRRLRIPADASGEEVAAMVTIVSSHLDREAAAETDSDDPETVNPWSLAGRLGLRDPSRVPTNLETDRAWAHADRTSW